MKTQRFLLGCLAAILSLVTPSQGATNTATSGTVYIIPIKDVIDNALIYVIRRGLNEAENNNASAIILDMDTPGGRLDSAEEILAMLRGVKVPTYTFVNPNAISAGAIIAMGTDHIWMTPGSKIGDAMPIMISIFGSVEEMPEAIEEKSVSYVAAMIRSAAQHKGHDPQLAEAMVRRDSEYKIGDDVISPKGRLLTLTNKDAERLVGPEKRPLLSAGTIGSIDELLAKIGRSENRRIELRVTQAEKVARLIESFSIILLALGLLGIYIEFKTPGFGLPGILGMMCLAVWFWGYNIAGLAGMEELALFVLGLALLIVEIFVIPGFGFVGIAGIALILISILMAMVQYYPGDPWYPSYPKFRDPITNLGLAGILSVAGLLIASRFLPKSTTFKKLILETANTSKDGFAASSDTAYLIGHIGITLTPLRASGSATFDEQRLNVVTRGEFIEAGQRVRITEAHGNRIVVEKQTERNNMNSTLFTPMIALLVGGILMIGAEVFVPGAVLGTFGAISLVGAIIMAFAISPVFGLYIAGGVIILTALGVMLWIKYFPRLSIGRKMTLEADGKAFKASDAKHPLPGQQGLAQSDLRPAGFALFNGQREDVVTEGGMIKKGEAITVVQVAGNRIVVRKVEG